MFDLELATWLPGPTLASSRALAVHHPYPPRILLALEGGVAEGDEFANARVIVGGREAVKRPRPLGWAGDRVGSRTHAAGEPEGEDAE